MTEYRLEGGPDDGRTLTIGPEIHTLRVPVMRHDPVNVLRMPDPYLSFDVVEYVKSGNVYRWDGLITDARAEMDVPEEAFREVEVRREARRMLRRQLEDLDPDKEVDRIVWVVARDPFRFMFRLAGFVGGRRSEFAALRRADLRGRAVAGWGG